MNQHVTQDRQGAMARFGRRVVALVTECNYAQNRLSNAQHTPERY